MYLLLLVVEVGFWVCLVVSGLRGGLVVGISCVFGFGVGNSGVGLRLAVVLMWAGLRGV